MNVDREGLAKKFVKPPNPNQKKGAEDRQKSGERERNVGHEKGEEHSRRPKGGFKPKGMRGLGRGSSGLGWLELLPSKQKCILLPKYFECSPPPKQCFPDTNSNSSGW